MIVQLDLAPGAFLNEQSLASDIGIGRVPVREALARLANDRFVTVIPRRGTMVTPLSLDDVLDMFEARETIECGVAYIAATRATRHDLDSLRELAITADQAREASDYEEFLRDDHAAHRFLVQMIRNPILKDAADRLLLHSLRFWRLYWTDLPVRPESMHSHTDIVTALETRDPEIAEDAMRRHIRAAREAVKFSF